MKNEKFLKLIFDFVRWFAFAVVGFILVLNLFYTARMGDIEMIIITASSPFIWIALLFALLLTIILLPSKIHIGKKIYFLLSLLYFAFNVGIIVFLKLLPITDQAFVAETAKTLISGDDAFGVFASGGYMHFYPHQFSFVKYLEAIYRLFPNEGYLAVQILNAVWLWLLDYLFVKMCRFFSGKERYEYGILLMLFIPMSFYTTYVYGNILSLTLSVAASYLLLCALESVGKKKWLLAFGVIVLSIMSYLVKNNSLIFVIAEICIFIVLLIKNYKKNFRFSVIMSFVLILALWGLGRIMLSECRNYSEFDDPGIPKSAWVAMGLTDGGAFPGWFDYTSEQNYVASDYNSEEADRLSKAIIRNAVKDYMANPKKAAQFFTDKTISQWANPNFEGFWIMQKSFIYGRNEQCDYPQILEEFLGANSYSQIAIVINKYLKLFVLAILMGTVIFLLKNRLDINNSIFLITFIGGFLFHLVWEAKCQYTLSYFVLLIPYAFAGYEKVAGALLKRISNRKNQSS